MADFHTRLRNKDPLIGTFLKLPTTQGAEIMGSLGFDFAVIDEEHAALNPETTDAILLACRASGLAGVVRVRDAGDILRVLDCGADGVLLPHVTSAAVARDLVALCRYRRGRRGFSPTTRAGAFGARAMPEQLDTEDRRIVTIAMIEDAEAIDQIDQIVAVEGLDAIFIGRGDLAVSMGGDIAAATARAIEAANAAGKVIAIMPSDAAESDKLRQRGASVFICGSDQGYLRSAARAALIAHTTALTGKE